MKQTILKLLILTALFTAFGITRTFAQQNQSLTPKEILRKSLKTLEDQKAWTGEMIASNDSTSTSSKFLVEFLAPDKSRVVWTFEGKIILEGITIGQDDYVNLDGKWEKSKKDKFDEFVNKINKLVDCVEEKYMGDVEFAGKELLDGIETDFYQYDYDVKGFMKDFMEKMQTGTKPPDRFEEMKVKVWINPQGLPVKFESVNKIEESKGKITTLKKTTTYRFDREIKIEAPKLVAGIKKKNK